MAGTLIGIGGVAFILVVAEVLGAAKLIRQAELSRKFVHIMAATFIATWPFFMSFGAIQVLSIILLAVVFVSKKGSIFGSVHGVSRLTYGEFLFPIAVFLSAALAGSEWVFAAAMLHLGLADGLAAVVGVQSLGNHIYKVFGHAKSLIGSLVFLTVSVTVTAAIVFWADASSYGSLAVPLLIWLPVTATLTENFAVYGTDNLLVPLLVTTSLNAAQVTL